MLRFIKVKSVIWEIMFELIGGKAGTVWANQIYLSSTFREMLLSQIAHDIYDKYS